MTITPEILIFGLMAACAVGGGFGVVSSRNLVHAALYLILSLFGVGGLFLMLEAPFLAAVQILVYVGAISVLITITVMVTRRVMSVAESVNTQWALSAVVGVLIFATLSFIIINLFGNTTVATEVPADNVAQLGAALVDHQGYLLPFEVASVLLLAALIGAIVVARETPERMG